MIFNSITCPLWRSRRRQQQSIIANEFGNYMSPKKIINPASLSIFPVHTISKEGSSSSTSDNGCIICLDRFAIGDQIRTLPCNHQYHLECIDPWLTIKSALCPLCKYDCTMNIPPPLFPTVEDEAVEETPPSRSQTPNSIFSSLRSASPSTFGPTIRADRVEEFSRSWMAKSLPRTMRRQIHEAAQAAALANEEVELPARMTQPPEHIVSVPVAEKKNWQASIRKKIPIFSNQ